MQLKQKMEAGFPICSCKKIQNSFADVNQLACFLIGIPYLQVSKVLFRII